MTLRLLMAGLPESGKTTFLAALYELVGAEPPLDGSLRLTAKPADREYFFEINQAWLKLEELGHSNVTGPRHAKMPLAGPEGEFELDIPDIVGERFLEGWEGTLWPEELQQIAQDVDGILLFAHGASVKPPVKLTPGAQDQNAKVPSPDDAVETPSDWQASDAPTQTMLADLLEGLSDLNERPLPTAVVVSAWDAVPPGLTPNDWLQLNMPLLWQMLEGRGGDPPYQVFGVSAQGGDVADAAERDRLARVQPPRDRIYIQQDQQRSEDISAPVRWLLDLRQ